MSRGYFYQFMSFVTMKHSIKLKVFAVIFVGILICHNTWAQKYSFFHLSDVHVTAPELIKSKGKAWEKFNTNGPNLYDESLQLFKSSLDSVRAARPDFLIISGDMTKDGEKVGHKLVAGLFAEIQNEGIKVFVIPGNHDVDNPFARYYDGDSVWYAEPTTSKDFAEIYADFGYNDAVSRDETSLSYIVYPYKDLALLCMDSNDFAEDRLVWPVKYGYISRGVRGRHSGVDMMSRAGDPVYAVADGVVEFIAINSAKYSGYGKMAVIRHDGKKLWSLYSHCSEIYLNVGQEVKRGQKIASVGRTGRATCNHLHFELRGENKKLLNPLEYLPEEGALGKKYVPH